MTAPTPRIENLAADDVRRVLLTVSCSDADPLPKVDNAGEIIERADARLQIMHNGLLIEEGCYYGPWMTEIIRALRGHHEPQEEFVFHHIIERLRESGPAPAMVELGSFWTYYGMWFGKAFPAGRVIAMEPDPAYLAIGQRNWALNALGARVDFVNGAVGADPPTELPFVAESDGHTYAVPQYDLHALMERSRLNYADLVLADIQGAETVLLERARGDFAAGRIRFMIVSTHHQSISGSPLTHEHALATLVESGAHVIAEHTVYESFSGDGMIAVSFDERDADVTIEIGRARPRDSIYGAPEVELDQLTARLAATERERDEALRSVSAVGSQPPARRRARLLAAPRALLGRISSR